MGYPPSAAAAPALSGCHVAELTRSPTTAVRHHAHEQGDLDRGEASPPVVMAHVTAERSETRPHGICCSVGMAVMAPRADHAEPATRKNATAGQRLEALRRRRADAQPLQRRHEQLPPTARHHPRASAMYGDTARYPARGRARARCARHGTITTHHAVDERDGEGRSAGGGSRRTRRARGGAPCGEDEYEPAHGVQLPEARLVAGGQFASMARAHLQGYPYPG